MERGIAGSARAMSVSGGVSACCKPKPPPSRTNLNHDAARSKLCRQAEALGWTSCSPSLSKSSTRFRQICAVAQGPTVSSTSQLKDGVAELKQLSNVDFVTDLCAPVLDNTEARDEGLTPSEQTDLQSIVVSTGTRGTTDSQKTKQDKEEIVALREELERVRFQLRQSETRLESALAQLRTADGSESGASSAAAGRAAVVGDSEGASSASLGPTSLEARETLPEGSVSIPPLRSYHGGRPGNLEKTGVFLSSQSREEAGELIQSGRYHARASGGMVNSRPLNTTGRQGKYPETLKQFWFPVAFSRDVDIKTLIPLECFDEPWVVFRSADGMPGCIHDQCAHRACPLSLGSVADGHVVCPYHGWEFSRTGKCEKMPSTKCTEASVRALPCVERDGIIWIWPAGGTPPEDAPFPDTRPPSHYAVHAELVMELPVEHGLLVENLLDLAHAPFTHTTTFARGWSVPNSVRFKTAASLALQGHWDPYPIAMEFRPPCVVVSTIGLAKPGQLEGGQTAAECSQHLFQMHACVPCSPGKTRLLYRMGLDFASWVKHVPFIDRLWKYLAGQVLDEDLRLVLGQQDRMQRGGNVWNHPVIYDKLGVRYRRWRIAVEAGEVPRFQ